MLFQREVLAMETAGSWPRRRKNEVKHSVHFTYPGHLGLKPETYLGCCWAVRRSAFAPVAVDAEGRRLHSLAICGHRTPAAMVRRLRYRNGNSRDAARDVFLRIIKEREAVHPGMA